MCVSRADASTLVDDAELFCSMANKLSSSAALIVLVDDFPAMQSDAARLNLLATYLYEILAGHQKAPRRASQKVARCILK